ncbi:MAG: formamidopyrimidine-DNA glycolase [Frankiales bacterium]|nr:formamidopyrimidine-DNA glycolase [Frankiales bacterium]
MPEGHVLHRAAIAHTSLLAGHAVTVSSPQGKFAQAPELDGVVCEGVTAYGKHVFYNFGDRHIHVHLGLRGFFMEHAGELPEPLAWVRMRLAVDAGAVDLLAPMKCEVFDDAAVAAVVKKLGPDPLASDDDDEAVRRLRTFRGPVGVALLDQGMWAGLGNAFRSELLYLARILPTTPCADLTDQQALALWRSAQEQMLVGARLGVIATVDGETDAKWVYKQESCRGCGTPIETATIAARLAHWCPAEQQ